MCVYYVFYVYVLFFKGRYVTLSCTLTLIFETHSSDRIAEELDRSMDVKLYTMLEILANLPATSPCPSQTKAFRQQVANHIQFTKKQLQEAYMVESVEAVQEMCTTYHFTSNVRENVAGAGMIFLTSKGNISMGKGEATTFHLVLSCATLLENALLEVPYSSVGILPAHNDVVLGPSQLHLDETYKILVNNYPLLCIGHTDVQLR